ncbi:MAG: hypothetical protein U0790_22965 [Isosphaeraceae bacterium]
MSINSANLVLAAWVPLTLLLYGRLGPVRGALAALLGGWALLPNAEYPAAMIEWGDETFGWAHACCLAASPLWNKASAIGLGCLLGVAFFDGPALRRLRPRAIDGLLLLFALTPVAAAWSNGLPISMGLAQARHLALAWGAPYLVGRTRFSDSEALRDLGRAWAIAGLVTCPLAFVEFLTGPIGYHWLYGPHPYRFSGAERWLGNRPMTLLEDGNQWGMWSATAALAGVWLWASGERRLLTLGRVSIPMGPVAGLLVGVSLVGQSHGSIVLLAAGLAALAVSRHRPPGWAVWGGLAAVPATAAAALAYLVSRSGGLGGLRGTLRSYFHGIGKGSFTWRLARVLDNLDGLMARPVLGHGRADWSLRTSDGRFPDPVGIPYLLLETGFHGPVGGLASMAVLAAPIVRGLIRFRRLDLREPSNAAAAMAAAMLAINLADLFFNSVLILPVLAAAGGLVAWSPAAARERPPDEQRVRDPDRRERGDDARGAVRYKMVRGVFVVSDDEPPTSRRGGGA